MPVCSQCNAPIPDGDAVCGSCGAPALGSTSSFEPVGTADSDQGGTSESIDGPVLIVHKGPQPGEKFFLDRQSLTVGRDPKADIFLNDMTVSRAHAVLTTDGTVVRVKDSGSLNGTFVNDEYVEEAVLVDGDVVQIGTFQMKYYAGSDKQ